MPSGSGLLPVSQTSHRPRITRDRQPIASNHATFDRSTAIHFIMSTTASQARAKSKADPSASSLGVEEFASAPWWPALTWGFRTAPTGSCLQATPARPSRTSGLSSKSHRAKTCPARTYAPTLGNGHGWMETKSSRTGTCASAARRGKPPTPRPQRKPRRGPPNRALNGRACSLRVRPRQTPHTHSCLHMRMRNRSHRCHLGSRWRYRRLGTTGRMGVTTGRTGATLVVA